MNLEENPLKKQESGELESEMRAEDLVVDPEKMKEVQQDLTQSVEKAQNIGEDITQETDPEKRQALLERYGKVLKKVETVIKIGVALGVVYVAGHELDVIGSFGTSEDIKDYATNTEKMASQLKAVGSVLGTALAGVGTYFGSGKVMNLFKKKETGNEAPEA